MNKNFETILLFLCFLVGMSFVSMMLWAGVFGR